MPKGQKKVKSDISEDDILLGGFASIREGILNQDWDLVRQGYESVSGEKLPIKEKTKLEKLREGLKKKAKNDPKATIIKDTDSENQTFDDVAPNIPLFPKERVIVSSAIDEKEIKENIVLASKKISVPKSKRTGKLVDESNTDKDARFLNVNRPDFAR